LALRAGNEKDEDEADTVGCCSLRVEHVKLHKEVEDIGDYVVEFDFLGKDSIRLVSEMFI
jgi:DNA topoisomerase-1